MPYEFQQYSPGRRLLKNSGWACASRIYHIRNLPRRILQSLRVQLERFSPRWNRTVQGFPLLFRHGLRPWFQDEG